jgi:hypothetical protein
VELKGKAHLGGYADLFPSGGPDHVYFSGHEVIKLGPWGYKVYADRLPQQILKARKGETDLEILVKLMTGSFSSREQADADTGYFDIRLEMVPIWRDRTDGYWLYVEQAMATHEDRPYRQDVYHLAAGEEGGVRSEVYSIPDPLRFAGAWKDPGVLAVLSPDSLVVREGCSVILKRKGFGFFKGGTAGEECMSNLRGAVYATSEVTVTPQGLTTWDRGYDENGNQVWGATEGGYIFKRKKQGGR